MVRTRSSRSAFAGLIATASIALATVGGGGSTTAAATPEEELAARFAPIISVQRHDTECGDGEPYAPVAVESVLDRDDVVLRDAAGTIIKERPAAADLFAAAGDAHLDFPGNALKPGCDYERWFNSTGAAATPTVYSRVVIDPDEPDRLALQYWLFWVYNDWNDRHEGDWEMLQLAFDVSSVEQALQTTPIDVAVAQHEGSERRTWDRVQLQGEHPVVFPGTGSHATYYTADRWFGKSAASGFGCDDTRGPSTLLTPTVVMLPDAVTGPDDPFAWLQFEGHWGEAQPSFNNGPTGPITKDQWTHPIVWMDTEGRTSSVSLPAQGSKVTDFFCTASTQGSLLFLSFLDRPWLVGLGLLAILGLLVWAARRTRWGPAIPLPLTEQRHAGQILTGAVRLLQHHRRRFLPVSLMILARGAIAFVLQQVLLGISSADDVAQTVGTDTGLAFLISLAVGALVTIPITVYAFASATQIVKEIDGAPPIRPALRGTVALSLVIAFSWVFPPLAIFLAVSWSVSPSSSARESWKLTRGRRLRITPLLATTFAVAAVTGPLAGTLVLLISNASFAVVNLISTLIAAFTLPWAAAVLTLLHGDLAARAVCTPTD